MRYRIVLLLIAALALLAEPRQANAAEPSCWPAQAMGSGTLARAERVELMPQPQYRGWVVWWYCSDEFEWSHRAFTCLESQLAQCLTGVDTTLTDPAKLEALRAQKVKTPLRGVPNEWICAYALRDHIGPKTPAPPAYAVAKNGSYTTRPAYTFTPATATTPAVRAPVGTARATVTATCDCKVRLYEGKTLYCAVNQERTLVAVCARL